MNQNKDLGKYYDDNHGLLDYLVKEMGGVSGPNSGAQGGIGGGSIGDYSKIPDLKTGVKKLVIFFIFEILDIHSTIFLCQNISKIAYLTLSIG